jgi:hypothetical protein
LPACICQFKKVFGVIPPESRCKGGGKAKGSVGLDGMKGRDRMGRKERRSGRKGGEGKEGREREDIVKAGAPLTKILATPLFWQDFDARSDRVRYIKLTLTVYSYMNTIGQV